MNSKMDMKKNVKRGIVLVVVGALICVIGFAISDFDESRFYENGDHTWYKTVRLGDDFLYGIGE